MKKSLLLLLSSCTALSFAQPVMQNIMPIGFNCVLSFGPATSPGPAGANQIWNFSSVPATPSATLNIVTPGATPCSSSFPTSNWAQNISGSQFNYYISTASQLEVIGEQISPSCTGGLTYSNSKIVLKFPFNYTNSFSDPFVNTSGPGTVTTTYDGYGTLITPSGTYSNVARVSFSDPGGTSYEWFDTGSSGHPLCLIVGSNTIFFHNTNVGVNEMSIEESINVYPNPVHGSVKVSLNEIPLSVNLFNSIGVQIMSLNPSLEEFDLDLTAQAPGIYFLKFSTSNGIGVKKIVIE